MEEAEKIRVAAIAEFDAAVGRLRAAGLHVEVACDEYLPERKDAVFPNNWLSTHDDGSVFLYPMQAKARRTERRMEVVKALGDSFVLTGVVDISAPELEGKFLEGTGSLVFDYLNRLVYASRSLRTDEALARAHAGRLDYSPIIFDALDKAGRPVYHTNVVMCVGTGYAVICLECIPPGPEKDELVRSLRQTQQDIVDISYSQMEAFAGNMLEVCTSDGKAALVMSATAERALSADQKNILKKYANLIAIDIPVIEKYGGGSARCMMAGIHLPLK